MSSRDERIGDTELWRRWKETEDRDGAMPDAPDPLTLAAYAEGRLDEAAAEPVEAWLAVHPKYLDDIIAARISDASSPVSEATVNRALGLVAAPAANVMAFRQPTHRAPFWRMAAAWGGIAASVAATGMLGFVLGSTAYSNLNVASEESLDDMLDPPTGFFFALTDDRST